jgi:hypothetical protein
MLTWLASFLGGPVITGLISAYKAKLAAGNTEDKIAADLAGRELAVQQAELETQAQLRIAEIGHWYEPDHLFGYIMVAYFAKVVIWDVTLGLGSTDPLRGEVATWANLVIVSYFGKRTFENVTRILKR